MTTNLSSTSTGNATEAAQLIAQIVPNLPLETARELARLLGHEIAAPSRARLREARLGLLTELMSLRSDPRPPSEEEYNALRDQRAEIGQNWPTSRTLRNAYGHWLKAVRAATNHLRGYNEDGKRITVPSSNAHRGRHKSYTRQDILDDIKRARLAIGDWPSEWEYEEFNRITRLLAKRQGKTKPRIAGLKQIRNEFGDYARAREAARQFWAEHGIQ